MASGSGTSVQLQSQGRTRPLRPEARIPGATARPTPKKPSARRSSKTPPRARTSRSAVLNLEYPAKRELAPATSATSPGFHPAIQQFIGIRMAPLQHLSSSSRFSSNPRGARQLSVRLCCDPAARSAARNSVEMAFRKSAGSFARPPARPTPPRRPATRRSSRCRRCETRGGWRGGSRRAGRRKCCRPRSAGCGHRAGTRWTGSGP